MKLFSTIFLLFLSFSAFSQAGTSIMFQDEFGPATLDFVATDVNGFHSYSDGGAPSVEIRVVHTGTRWEVQFGISDVLFFSNENTGSNPPNLAVGNWQNGVNGGANPMTLFGGTGTTGVILPTELLAFTAQITAKNRVTLEWNTANETDNDRFEVEASSTGEQFSRIGTVAGAGTIAEGSTYEFDDQTPGQGMRYYRLRQVDFDGTFAYSHVVSVELQSSESNTISLSPNPATAGTVQLTYQAAANGNVNTTVFNISGQQLLTQQHTVVEGANTIPMDLVDLKAGLYFVRVQGGGETSSLRLTVK
jgi:hypothetical protein